MEPHVRQGVVIWYHWFGGGRHKPKFEDQKGDGRDVSVPGDYTGTSSVSLVQSLSRIRLFATPWTAACQTNSCPFSQWCHLTISSSVVPFSHLQSFPASGSFQMSQLFASGGHSIGASASKSVLPMNIQDWSSLRWTGWMTLQFKGLSRVFSNTIVQKHQFFGTQPSLWSNTHIYTWPQENHCFDYMDFFWQRDVSSF